ncbi:MAG: dUTP diphosphatase [Chromatocurvus sp.]
MQQALATMLTMQDAMNARVHPDWHTQNFAWYRALWIECAELLDHYGYKWWKAQHADMPQVQMEVVDIWHFGLSALLVGNHDIPTLSAQLDAQIHAHTIDESDLRLATETLARDTLISRTFPVPAFLDVMHASGLTLEVLYRAYVGKNVLNFFRQDNGYKEGSYRKEWQGREDNEHLHELLAVLDNTSSTFPDDLYAALAQRYRDAA